jgi:hypothetical protein
MFLHKGIVSKSIWISFRDFLTRKESLQELTVDCRLTVEQTELLYHTLSDSTALKTLHMLNVWESKDELVGCKTIFKILEKNNSLIEFTLTCSTNQLRLDFDDFNFHQNESLTISRSAKCQTHQITNVEFFENFLQNFSIHILSLKSIDFHCEASIQRLARAVDMNETLDTLELKGSDCSAIFHRENHIHDNENSVLSSSAARTTSKNYSNLFIYHRSNIPIIHMKKMPLN